MDDIKFSNVVRKCQIKCDFGCWDHSRWLRRSKFGYWVENYHHWGAIVGGFLIDDNIFDSELVRADF